MSTSILNVSTSDHHSPLNTKPLKTIDVDVDDLKAEEVLSETTKFVRVQVINEDVHDGKEVEVELETEEQTAPTSDKLAEAEVESLLSEQEYVDDALTDEESELFRAEMELALEHIRKLALFQQESVVNSICDTFASYNGEEASINDVSAIFGRIKREFALEALEDELEEEYDEIEDEIDSDYHPNDDRYDYELDNDINEIDYVSEDADDSDYDPNDAEDIKQAEADLDEDGFDDLSEEEAEKEEEELEQISFDEDAIINSEEFDEEYFDAIQCAVSAAKLEKQRILEKISKKYQSEFGDEVIERAFEQFVDFAFEEEAENEVEEESANKDENEEEEEDEVDVSSEEYRKNLDVALDNVRKLAAKHQEAFVDEVCGAFEKVNGFEPSVSELSSIFNAIKMEFAEEARKEFLSDIEEEEEDESGVEQEDIVNVD